MSCRILLLFLWAALPLRADDATDALAKELRDYATAELAKVPGKDGKYSTALPDYLRERIVAANRRDRRAWEKVTSHVEWIDFCDERIRALEESLGAWPDPPRSVPVRVTKTIEAADYRIDNLLYESRPGVWVTGNLYYPARPRGKMPIILIAHSHHASKEQGELQDMGVTWAKTGCMVLVIDQLGHGERRQHPFSNSKDFPNEFRVGRQDYYFRYNLNLQLSLVGDTLMGWMVWDLKRGLDVVLARPGSDEHRIILLGAVAGGGDVAAVTAAMDIRIHCVVPFNFGGPQPETRYPLPEDAEESFNYAGSGSWESTRNLRDSAAKGFLPWVIVASVAPRKVIHAHEFAWDRDRDPVWNRYQKVWGFYNAANNLAFTHGTGVIHGNDPTASHCTNIGPLHRKGIYTALKKWVDIPVPEKESRERRSAEELRCWTPAAERELKPRPLHEVLAKRADESVVKARIVIAEWKPKDPNFELWTPTRTHFYRPWRWDHRVEAKRRPPARPLSVPMERIDVGTHRAFSALLFKPPDVKADRPLPLVICVCQDGPDVFLRERAGAVAALLRSGVAVCLPQLMGTGSERPGAGRGRTSATAALTATAWMNSASLLGWQWEQLYELTSLLIEGKLGKFGDIALWGESLAPANSLDQPVGVPLDLSQPRSAEPLGGLLAAFVGMSDKRIKAVAVRGAIMSYRSLLDSPFVLVPPDVFPVGDPDMPEGVFQLGDLPEIWATLQPRALRLEGLVNGINRRVTGERLEKALRPVTAAYQKGGLVVREDYTPDAELAKWIIEQLRR